MAHGHYWPACLGCVFFREMGMLRAAILLLATLAGMAQAHEFWLWPDDFAPDVGQQQADMAEHGIAC